MAYGTLNRLASLAISTLLLSSTFAWAAVGDQFANVDIEQSEKTQAGRIAFIDSNQAKLIELDLTGKITWEYSLPWALIGLGTLSAGTDVEWLPESDNFLIAIAGSGVFEINRKAEVVWKYETRFADHDADRLANGNTVFVNGWDADTDPVVTEVDSAGKIVMQLFAEQLGLSTNERHSVPGERFSNTHANAIQRLDENEYLISLRNYNQFLKFKDGKVVARFKKAKNVHDPVPYKEGFLFAVHIADSQSALVHHQGPGQRQSFFKPETGTWSPLRSVELLHNGNVLITGSRQVGQLDQDGKLVWAMTVVSYESGKSEQKTGRFIYKAAFVYK